eukprot:gene13371-14697_t
MADFPFNHVLAQGIVDLNVGATLSTAEVLQSGNFVCFLRDNALVKGFFFRNGSNGRVKTVKNGFVTNTTLKSGGIVINCTGLTTNQRFGDAWTVAQLQPNQITGAADVLLLRELSAIRDMRNLIEDIVGALEQLTMGELTAVRDRMRELRA